MRCCARGSARWPRLLFTPADPHAADARAARRAGARRGQDRAKVVSARYCREARSGRPGPPRQRRRTPTRCRRRRRCLVLLKLCGTVICWSSCRWVRGMALGWAGQLPEQSPGQSPFGFQRPPPLLLARTFTHLFGPPFASSLPPSHRAPLGKTTTQRQAAGFWMAAATPQPQLLLPCRLERTVPPLAGCPRCCS